MSSLGMYAESGSLVSHAAPESAINAYVLDTLQSDGMAKAKNDMATLASRVAKVVVLYVVGGSAGWPLTPPAMHHEMAAKLNGAPVSIVEAAGHLSNIENATGFNRAALDWLLPRAQSGDSPRNWVS